MMRYHVVNRINEWPLENVIGGWIEADGERDAIGRGMDYLWRHLPDNDGPGADCDGEKIYWYGDDGELLETYHDFQAFPVVAFSVKDRNGETHDLILPWECREMYVSGELDRLMGYAGKKEEELNGLKEAVKDICGKREGLADDVACWLGDVAAFLVWRDDGGWRKKMSVEDGMLVDRFLDARMELEAMRCAMEKLRMEGGKNAGG